MELSKMTTKLSHPTPHALARRRPMSMLLNHVAVALAAYSIILTAQGQIAASEGRCAPYTIKLDTNRLG
jgi:hypothetical protein